MMRCHCGTNLQGLQVQQLRELRRVSILPAVRESLAREADYSAHCCRQRMQMMQRAPALAVQRARLTLTWSACQPLPQRLAQSQHVAAAVRSKLLCRL